MFESDDPTLSPLRLIQGNADRRRDGSWTRGEPWPPAMRPRQAAGATIEMLREAAITVDRALRSVAKCVASGWSPATSSDDEHRDALARHAVRLMDLAVDVPSPSLRAAAIRAGADCRDLANVAYRGPTRDEVARAAARLEAVRLGCDVLEEQLSDALRAMLRASLWPAQD